MTETAKINDFLHWRVGLSRNFFSVQLQVVQKPVETLMMMMMNLKFMNWFVHLMAAAGETDGAMLASLLVDEDDEVVGDGDGVNEVRL